MGQIPRCCFIYNIVYKVTFLLFYCSSIGNIFTSLNSLKPMCVLAGAFIRDRITLFWVHCSLDLYFLAKPENHDEQA